MTIDTRRNKDKLTFKLEGRLDTTTAPELEQKIVTLEGVANLLLDFEKLEYISSAGLRVLMIACKIMDKQGKMAIRNVNEEVMEVFRITGFSDILTIE